MKQIKKYFVLTLLMFFLFLSQTEAATLTITASSTSVTVGSSVTIKVNAPDLAGKFSVTSSNSNVLTGGTSAVFLDQSGASYTFTAKAAGTATVTITPLDASDYSGNAFTSSKSVTITVKEKQQVVLSSNNSLAALSVEGATLSPEFNTDTLEYTVELNPETTSINISATAKETTATIAGAGTREVKDGANRLEIPVTAQNGSVRTYVINATVKEYNPIEVTVENQKLTVVRKKGDLTAPNNYTETTVKINNEDVPAFTSTITGLTVVGLKNEAGVIALYSYDGSSTYTKYVELSFHRVILTEQTPDKIPFGFEKKSMKIGENEVTVYWNDKTEKTLLYGMNVETGKQNFYNYEESENTLQIYKEEKNQDEFYLKIMIVLGTTTVLFLGSTIVLTIKLMKHRKIKVKPIPEEDVEETEKESE